MRSDSVRRAGGIVLIWLVYVVAIEAIARAVHRDSAMFAENGPLHGFLADLSPAPPLARWDSVWFYHIAEQGYHGRAPASRHAPGFLPLYPLAMRATTACLGGELFTAGLWVSRLSLLAAMFLLSAHARHAETNDAGWPAIFALLAFPSAFVLVSVYSESLFLATALASFVLAERKRYWPAALAAFLAGLTRIHAVALVPALFALGWTQWRRDRSLSAFAPAAGGMGAWLLLCSYFAAQFDDPWRYFTAKREHWRIGLSSPWTTIDNALQRIDNALAQADLGSLTVLLELPCLYLLALASAVLAVERRWHASAYVALGAALTLFSGSTWGLPRFALLLFPTFILIARLHRRPAAWYVYLLVGSLLQACALVNYVNFRSPAP
ncbi:MAG: hypothetical protein WD847_20390 [Pirellulales bacterium]